MVKQIAMSILMCLIIAAYLPLYGQQQEEKALGQLWPKVEEYYPGIKAKQALIDAAQLNARAVKGERLPQLKAQAQNTYGTYEGSSGAFFPQPGFFNVSGSSNPLNATNMTANSFGSATIEWDVFAFGKHRKELEAAKLIAIKMVSEKNAYLLYLKKILSERYISLLYNDAKLNIADKNSNRLDDIRKITAGLSAAGLKPAADSLIAYSYYVQAMGEQDKWNGYKNASFIKLEELTGGGFVDYRASAIRFTNPAKENTSIENRVHPSHPILDALDQTSQYYLKRGEVIKRTALPSLRVLGGYAYRGTGIQATGTVSNAWKDGFKNNTNNMLVGIGITWNITGLYINRLKGEALFKESESNKLLHTQYEQGMQADLSASQAKISQQIEQLRKTEIAVNQSNNAYSMYLARYKSGLITLSELLQIRSLLEQAEHIHIEVSREYWMLLAYKAELINDFDFLFNTL